MQHIAIVHITNRRNRQKYFVFGPPSWSFRFCFLPS